MTNILIVVLGLLVGIPLADWYHDKRQGWEDWKREAWKLDHPSTRRKQ